jgi:DNA-binding NarL/FixJ family response regulator
MVGRTSERVLLREQMAAMEAGRGQLVILGGEAGIGKTTLARDLIASAEQRGHGVLVGRCFDLTAASPYGIWLDLAADYQRIAGPSGQPVLPPVLANRNLDGLTSQSGFFELVRAFLHELAARQPTLIVLEDVHWADPASLELLRHIASQLSFARLLLVVTYRVDELTRQHPFYRHLPALVRESEGQRFDLKALHDEDLRELVATRYPMDPDDGERLVAYLAAHSEGNPFFATEILRAMEERGIEGLSFASGTWKLGSLDHLIVPDLVRQVIDARISRLGDSTREPLAIAAVIGQEIPLHIWADVAGLDDEALLGLIDQAIGANFFNATPDGTRVGFVHALTREALYESISPPRRRLLHRAVAEVLMRSSTVDPDAIAFHFQQAGDERAIEWLILAGDRAQRAYAWLTAGDRFLTAANMLQDVPGEEQTRARLLYRYGRLQRYSNAANGIESLELAERLATFAGDRVLAADAAYSRGLLRCFADEWQKGLAELIAGVEALEALPDDIARISWTTVNWMADALPVIDLVAPGDPDPAAEKLTSLGVSHRRGGIPWFTAASGRLSEAARIAAQFLEQVEVIGTGPLVHSAKGHALFGQGIALAAQGDPVRAREAFAAARQIYDRLDHHAVIAFTLLTELTDIAVPYFATDRALRLRVAAEAQLALERAGGALLADLSAHRAQLMNLFLDGEWQEAWSIAGEQHQHGNYVLRRQTTCTLAPIALHQGKHDVAWNHVFSVLRDGMKTPPGDAVYLDALMLQRLAAELSLAAGDPAQARSWLDVNDSWLAWSGAVLGRADNALAWARVLHASGKIAEALAQVNQAIATAGNPRQPLTLLAARRCRGVIMLDLGDVAGAERELMAALDLATTCEIPFERAQTLIELARLAAERGVAHAATLAGEARRIGEHLHAQPMLDRLVALSLPVESQGPAANDTFGLTTREIDVLRLAATGLTDAEIGERLFISPRTASQHLRSIYAKLNVRSRAAATRFAIDHHLA